MMTRISRRDLMKRAGITAAAVAALGLLNACGGTREHPAATAGGRSVSPASSMASLPVPGTSGLLGILDATKFDIPLTATTVAQTILPGKTAELAVYKATVGDRVFLNPIFRIPRGETFATTLTNSLGAPTNLHWHGLQVEWHMDGHPSATLPNGNAFRYSFTVQNRGGMYWYHPHPDGLTAQQTYSGLAGLFIVEDDDELSLRRALDLTLGVTDIPLVIQDKRFASNGRLAYSLQPMDQMMGFLGDTPLVNLAPTPTLTVQTRLYRFRALNGSNARTYRLAFVRGNDRLPYTLIGTDGGLLARPVPTRDVFLSPGERADLLLDLRTASVGDAITLQSLAFDPMENEMGMGSGMMGNQGSMGNMTSSAVPNGQALTLMKIAVTSQVTYDRAVPTQLSTVTPIATTGIASRAITLGQGMPGMQWLINGMTYQAGVTPITVKRGTTEVWNVRNAAASMPHPMHIHGFSFQVLERVNSPQQVAALAVDGQGRLVTDLGWKDTVLVWPGETVRIALDFTHPFAGEQRYVFHCHILEHEDNGMMLNFTVA